MKEKNTESKRKRKTPRTRLVKRLLVVIPVTMLVVTLVPTEAHAAGFLGIFPDIPAMIKQWLLDMSAGLLNGYNGMVSSIADNSILTEPFNSLLGTSTYSLIRTIHQTVIVPIGESILALIMLVQLVKISQRIDATSTFPAVKDIVFLAVFYVLFHWFIVHSLDVLSAVYSIVVQDIIPAIGNAASTTGFFSGTLTAPNEVGDDVTIGGCFMVLLVSLFSYLAGVIAFIVSLVVTYARAWQLYIMAVFSPIPVSLLGFEETRQSGISFLKNYVAVALSGAIIMLLIVLFPHILSSLALASPGSGGDDLLLALAGAASTGNVAGAASGFTIIVLIEWVALTILLIFALLKSGTWAKELLGQ